MSRAALILGILAVDKQIFQGNIGECTAAVKIINIYPP